MSSYWEISKAHLRSINEPSLAIAFSYRLHRLRTGLSVPYPAPYGYYYQPAVEPQNSCWVVVDEEAEVVRQIVNLNTRPDSPSIGEIVRRLNEQQRKGLG